MAALCCPILHFPEFRQVETVFHISVGHSCYFRAIALYVFLLIVSTEFSLLFTCKDFFVYSGYVGSAVSIANIFQDSLSMHLRLVFCSLYGAFWWIEALHFLCGWIYPFIYGLSLWWLVWKSFRFQIFKDRLLCLLKLYCILFHIRGKESWLPAASPTPCPLPFLRRVTVGK